MSNQMPNDLRERKSMMFFVCICMIGVMSVNITPVQIDLFEKCQMGVCFYCHAVSYIYIYIYRLCVNSDFGLNENLVWKSERVNGVYIILCTIQPECYQKAISLISWDIQQPTSGRSVVLNYAVCSVSAAKISAKEAEESKPDKTPVTTQTETQTLSVPSALSAPSTLSEAPAAEKPAEKPAPSAPPLPKPASNPPPSRAKKTMPGSPRLSVSRQLPNEAPQANKSVFTVLKKPSQSQEASNPAPEVRVLPVSPAPVPPSRPLQTHPNMQMRQNIRRSLTDTLLKRSERARHLDFSINQARIIGRLYYQYISLDRNLLN